MNKTKKINSVPRRKWVIGVLAGMAAVLPCVQSGAAASAVEEQKGACAAAMQQAASANKYLFAFFYEKDDDSTRAARKTFDAAVQKIAPSPQSVGVDRTAAAEKEIVTKYGLDRAPMPFVLAIAPNGAITGGFQAGDSTEGRLRDAVASPGMQQCLKALQERQLVLVCMQNGRTKANEAAMKGVNEFKADARFGEATVIVKVDPSDPKELKLLGQLKANPEAKTAATAFLAPPGVLVATLDGPTTKDGLIASLQKAMASCGSGCGPSGCGPR